MRLVAAARGLFAERGYDATRPQDVADAAGVAVGTFYVHFDDKRDAFLAFTDDASHELMERVRAATHDAPDFRTRLRASLAAIFAYSEEHPGVLRAAFADAAVISAGLAPGASLRDRLAASLAQGLREGAARGRLRGDLDADVVGAGMVGFIQHAFARGAEDRRDREVLIETTTRFLSAALDVCHLERPEPSS